MLQRLAEEAAAAPAAASASPAGLLRAQYEAGVAAAYAFAPPSGPGLPHRSLGLTNYAHCSSPIRRYADFHNQQVLFGALHAAAIKAPGTAPGTTPGTARGAAVDADGEGFSSAASALLSTVGVVDAATLELLNERATVLAQYHARVDAMELAYRCKETPTTFTGKIETDEDGTSLLVYTDKRRVRVPLSDTYFAEPLAELFGGASAGAEMSIELCGVLKAGRTQLRVRVAALADACLSVGAGFGNGAVAGASVPPGRTQGDARDSAELIEASFYYDTAAPSAEARRVERRIDITDGQPYTRQQFVDEYGGTREWDLAQPAPEPKTPNTAPGGGAAGSAAAASAGDAPLFEALRTVGVSRSMLDTISELEITREMLSSISAADLSGLTGCAPDEALTILTVAASLPATLPDTLPKPCLLYTSDAADE